MTRILLPALAAIILIVGFSVLVASCDTGGEAPQDTNGVVVDIDLPGKSKSRGRR